MTYGEFKRQNDRAKRYTSTIGRVSNINLSRGTCSLTVLDNVTDNLYIHNIVKDIVYNGMGAICNPSALRNWKGFK
jgi:hypothetical protein